MTHTKECNIKKVKCTCNCKTGGHFLECAIVKIGCNCNDIPIDAYSGMPFPSWPLRKEIMDILGDVYEKKLAIPVAREALMYMFSMAFQEGWAESQAESDMENTIQNSKLQ